MKTEPEVLTSMKVARFGGASKPAKIVNAVVRGTAGTIVAAWAFTPRFPWPYRLADQFGRLLVDLPNTQRQRVDFEHCSGALVTPTCPGRQVGLYLHGGALLVGGRHLHRSMIARIAGTARIRMVVPQYRQLPENSVEDAVADCLEAYAYALTLVEDPRDVIVMGDSAGGFLAFMVAVAARDAGYPMLGGIVVMSPLIELDHIDRVVDRRPAGEVLFNPRALRSFTKIVRLAQTKNGGGWPFIGPTRADLTGLPPTLIQTSSAEILHAEAMAVGSRLAEFGVPVEVQVWDGEVHVFQAAAGVLPEAAQALAHVAMFIQRIGDEVEGSGD